MIQVGGSTFTVGNYSKPCVVDWNNDGKKDILCGNYLGTIYLLLNTGTDDSPSFSQSVLIQDGGAALNATAWSMPLPVDWDRDGKKDLLVGNYGGTIRFYRNQGTDDSPVFNGYTNLIAGGAVLNVGNYSHPALSDWNADGAKDLIVGAMDGLVRCFTVIAQPTIIYDSLTLDDTAGNGDGEINPGESVKLTVTLQNLGANSATGVTATLSCADGYVTVTDNAASYGVMPGTERKQGGDPYEIQIAENCPTPRQLDLVLTVTDELGRTWTVPFNVTVYTTSQISGVVTLDGAAAADVTVEYTGPKNGTRVTDSQGRYLFGAIDGAYTLVAKKTGWLESAALQATVPGSVSNANFAFTTATISGRVTDALTGEPIAGATVEYNGPLSDAVTTGSDGNYTITRIYGRAATLTLVAKHSSYFDSAPVEVTVPPDSGGVNFLLGRPDIGVVPPSLTVQAGLHEAASRTLTISNTGGSGLNWAIWNQTDSAAALAAGDVKRQFSIPSDVGSPYGIAFDGAAVWVSNYGNKLYKLDPIDGHLLGTLDVSAICSSCWGLGFDGSRLWIAGYGDKKVYAVDPVTGAAVKTFDAPDGVYPTSVAFGGGSVWVMPYGYGGGNKVYRLNPEDGSVQGSVTMPSISGYVYGFTYFNGSLWTAAYYGDGKVYKISPADGSVLGTFQGPDTGVLDLSSDGQSGLWLLSYVNRKAYLVESGEAVWLSEEPDRGTVPALSSTNVTVSFDGRKVGLGTHQATIHVVSNDPDEPDVTVPVTFTVTDDNHAPVISDFSPSTPHAMNEGASQAFSVTAADQDADPLVYAWKLDGTTISGAAGASYTWSPDYSAAGQHTLDVSVNDGWGGTAAQSWTVDVANVNRAPVAQDVSVFVPKDTAKGITLTASDPDGDVLSYNIVAGPIHGTLSGTAPNLTYTPEAGYLGSDSFTFKANDGKVDSNVATVTLTVREPSLAAFVQTNSVTQGSWKGTYGTDGYCLVADAQNYPSYAQVTVSGKSDYTWAGSTSEIRALEKAGSSDRLAACWYSSSPWTIDINLTDGKTHRVAVYCLDWDGNDGRAQRMEVLDADTQDVLDSRDVAALSSGKYMVWDFRGHVIIRLTQLGINNSVVSGLFFDDVTADANGNGMPDVWEIQYFGSTANLLGAPDADWDGDGMCNLKEYLAGTDPTDAASMLEVSGFRVQGSGEMMLSWSSVTGKRYLIEYATNLMSGFTGVAASNIAATPPVNTSVVTGGGGGGGRFYRIRLEE